MPFPSSASRERYQPAGRPAPSRLSALDRCCHFSAKVAGRLHVELVRVSGAAPERLAGGDDSSENSSESSCYEVMDTNGEIVHMAKRLTCRVGVPRRVWCLLEPEPS